jgi:hypothetical protein
MKDELRLAKEYAVNRSLALGKAISELLRRAFTTPRPTRAVNGLQVFDLPPDSPRVTMKKSSRPRLPAASDSRAEQENKVGVLN